MSWAKFHARQPHRTRRGQAGVTLMECLVAIVVLAIMIGGVTTMATLSGATGSANQVQRVDSLLSSLGEAVKALPYKPCATKNDYQTAFNNTESSTVNALRLSQGQNVTFTVVQVTLGPDCATGVDRGTQVLRLQVTLDGKQRTGDVVKRDPSAATNQLVPTLNSLMTSTAGATTVVYRLDALGTTGSGIARYTWDCGSTPPLTYDVAAPDDPLTQCTYPAPAPGQPAGSATLTLKVTDVNGQSVSVTKVISLPAAAAPPVLPTALFSYSPAAPVTGSPTSFVSQSTAPTGRTIATLKWDFGDGTQLSCTAPDTSCSVATKNYPVGTYTVKLTVIDSAGLTASTSQGVVVKSAPVVPPTAVFTATPTTGLAPLPVAFDGTASKDGSGKAVASYAWDFGDGSTATGATPSKTYSTVGTYTVKLTVTATNGATASSTQLITVNALGPPDNVGVTWTKCYNRTSFACFYGFDVQFTWNNPAPVAGVKVTYDFDVIQSSACTMHTLPDMSTTVPAAKQAGSQSTIISAWWETCLGPFLWRARTNQTIGGVTQSSPWTDWASFTP
jgi:prepilin-type N-terminal cleavage/methylation domain-containing protein